MRRALVLARVLLAVLLVALTTAHVEQVSATSDVLGTSEWPHLDCSRCLAVAALLGSRMNTTLKQAPGSYLVSHRLDKDASRRRVAYKTGELRAVEVLDGMCNAKSLKNHILRINPKTKVRGYHLTDYGGSRRAAKDELLEKSYYPDTSSLGRSYWTKLSGLKLPVAHFYTRHEHEVLGQEGLMLAPQTACVHMLDEYDEELTEIVREADWLSEVEEQLCGLRWGHVVSTTRRQIRDIQEGLSRLPGEDDASTPGSDATLWKGLASPVSAVCRDVESVKASAARDQQRWFAWSFKRKEKRKATEGAKRANDGLTPSDAEKAASGKDEPVNDPVPPSKPTTDEDAADL